MQGGTLAPIHTVFTESGSAVTLHLQWTEETNPYVLHVRTCQLITIINIQLGRYPVTSTSLIVSIELVVLS